MLQGAAGQTIKSPAGGRLPAAVAPRARLDGRREARRAS